MRIAVIGVGTTMRSDDAAGVAAVRQWQKQFPETACSPHIQVQITEQPGPGLLELLAHVDAAILVDAVLSGRDAGTVCRFAEDKLTEVGQRPTSPHGWGIAETLRLGRLLYSADEEPTIRFVGIEASSFAPGPDLSAAVKRSLPEASVAIQAEVNSLL